MKIKAMASPFWESKWEEWKQEQSRKELQEQLQQEKERKNLIRKEKYGCPTCDFVGKDNNAKARHKCKAHVRSKNCKYCHTWYRSIHAVERHERKCVSEKKGISVTTVKKKSLHPICLINTSRNAVLDNCSQVESV